MYYYYAVISRSDERRGSYTTDCVGKQQTRVDAIIQLRDQFNAHILNMIELTEEEFQELYKKYESKD